MRRLLMIVLAACLLPLYACAQDWEDEPDTTAVDTVRQAEPEEDTTATGLTIRSTPSGARVTLKGAVTVIGVTPTNFQPRMYGEYKVTFKKSLFEKHTAHIELLPDRAEILDVRLSPKTRFKAAARSIFVPGWGQLYSEQPMKGLLFGVAAAGSVVGFLIADNDYQQKFDGYKAAERRYQIARDAGEAPDDLELLYGEYVDAQREASDAENIRRAMIGVTAGVWVLNFLDAVVFFPKVPTGVSVQGVNITPSSDFRTYGLVLSKKF